MTESIQHVLDRVRSPRVQITYDVEIGNAIEMKELPFVVGVLSDLSGAPLNPLPALKYRKFVEIDRDSFNEVLKAINPRLVLSVANLLGKFQNSSTNSNTDTSNTNTSDNSVDTNNNSNNISNNLSIELFFNSLQDFEPMNLIERIEALSTIYSARCHLRDLMIKAQGNDLLISLLQNIFNDKTKQQAILDQIANGSGDDLDNILNNAKLAISEEQKPNSIKLLQNFINYLKFQDANSPKDVMLYFTYEINLIDEALSAQINEILHQKDFQKLESAWRGLAYLVFKTETSTQLKIRVLNASKQELQNDLDKAIEFDQSQLFKKIYEEEYGTFGGHPYSCLIGDYEFGRSFIDIDFLEKISGVAAAAFAPFISAASSLMFDMQNFESLSVPRDLSKIMDSLELAKWKSFRNSPDSRYVNLVLPHFMLRMPYGDDTNPVEGLSFTEDLGTCADSDKFCWGNAAYALAERITHAFSLYKWTAAIRGVEGGGLVESLPAYTYKTLDGDMHIKCPTQVAITDRREKELSDNGFIALCYCKGTDYAAFFGGQTSQKSKIYNLSDATANSELSSRLPYMLAASRFAHYIKVIMRDKIGSFMSASNVSTYLNTWLANYILLNDGASQDLKAKYPLREGRVDVSEIPGEPGSYKAIVYLRPHFQLEDLSVSIRLVAKLPTPAS